MKNILIIDDEKEMLNGLKKIMTRRSDYNITLIQNPAEAIKTVEDREFDLIITDLKMKGFSIKMLLKNSTTMY